MIQISRLNAGYGRLQVLFDVSLEIVPKVINVVVGPNGSGKSTLLKSIFGLTNIYSGSIKLDGLEISRLPPHTIARYGIAYLPQVENIFSNLTVYENLRMAGYMLDNSTLAGRIDELLEIFPVLKRMRDRKSGYMSGGERQMLAIAMAMIRRPKVMLFDEPTGNLSPKMVTQILEIIARLRDEFSVTILLAEQNARRALELGDTAVLMVSGRPVFVGDSRDLLNHAELGRLYLGITPAGYTGRGQS
ncbi:High-affinity branched-chain amino acid transport ATP-binding protein LivF [archaeon HR01]|nr:High-affinity branched-chain amino acid transport ATP-binding protein LivF [archaeon HR01]